MLNWLKRQTPSQPVLVHPPWRAGQYVTYYLERSDGSWVAIALRILGQTESGIWAIEGNFKTVQGECTTWFRSDPDAPVDEPDPVPGKTEKGRQSPSSSDNELEKLAEDPWHAISLAMNLLMVRRWPKAAQSLSEKARPVDYPCGINQAHLLITSGPGYQKHHDLCPCVMLTGVACLSIDGGKNPMTATSFGLNDPAATGSTTYDDFVDLSHLKRIEHDGFELTYPATWFLLRQQEEEEDGLQITCHQTQVGGISCSLSCSVLLYSGDRHSVTEKQQAERIRLSGPPTDLSPRSAHTLRLPGDATGHVFDYVHPTVDGVLYGAIFGTNTSDRFALVNVFGCIAKANPRRSETMAEYERVFSEILGSFQFR